MCVCVCVCMYVCMYVCIYIHIYVEFWSARKASNIQTTEGFLSDKPVQGHAATANFHTKNLQIQSLSQTNS